LKTTNQEMPSSESGLTLSLLPYAVGAGEHGSPGVVATVPLRPLCRRYSGIRRKRQSVRWLRHREEENSNQAEDGTRGGHLKYLRERMAKEIRGKISEIFRSGHQAGLSCIRVSEHVSCLSSGCQENLSFVLANGLASSGRLDFRWRGCMLAYSVSGRN